MTKQSQKGGDASTNIQAEQMVVQVGIDEKRAREVFQEMNLQLKKDYTQEAFNIANARVSEFENCLMPKIEQVDGALEAFADPSFQLLLVEAQKTAASTERTEDYDLLSELLIHRFEKGENRIARAGISLAVEIVDKVSNEALLGLTTAHAVTSFLPTSGDVHQGLDTLNDLFGKIFYSELPTGQDWLDHLDVLNTIRLNSIGSMKKVQQYYPEVLPGYIDVGIEKESENHAKSIEILSSNNLPRSLLADHILNNDFQRISIANRKNLDDISLQTQQIHACARVRAFVRVWVWVWVCICGCVWVWVWVCGCGCMRVMRVMRVCVLCVYAFLKVEGKQIYLKDFKFLLCIFILHFNHIA